MEEKKNCCYPIFFFFLAFGNTVTAKELSVLLDWFINPDHAALVVALEAGIYEEFGLKVRLIEPGDPSMPPKMVAARQAEIAVSYQPSLMMDLENGLPLMRFGTLINTPLNSLVVLENGPIKKISDLKNKIIGFSVGGFEDILLSQMIKTAKLSLADITLVNVNFALSPSLYSGQVDAVIGAFRNFELNQMKLDKKPGRAFFPEDYGVPNYEELILITHPDYAEDERLKLFLSAINKATEIIQKNPEYGWKKFVQYRPEELDTPLNKMAWRDTIPKLMYPAEKTDPKTWSDFNEFMIKNKLIKKSLPTENYLLNIK